MYIWGIDEGMDILRLLKGPANRPIDRPTDLPTDHIDQTVTEVDKTP